MKVRELFEKTWNLPLDSGYVELTDEHLFNGELPADLKGATIKGSFDCSECETLISLKNAPDTVDEDCDFRNCVKLISMEGIGKDYLKSIGGELSLPPYLKSNILGLLKISNLRIIDLKIKIMFQLVPICNFGKLLLT